MCGPSGAMKRLNASITNFANTVAGEANTIFGDASGIFNDLKSSLSSIVKGGPSQQGWGAAEQSAVNTQIMEQAASNARNVRASVGGAMAAIGGGNAVTPSGLEQAVETSANLGVEAEKSRQMTQATVQNYETGRQNYWEAVKGETQLPSMFQTSIEANKAAQAGYTQAEQSQQQLDAASNWWQPLVMGAIGTGASFLTGGLSNVATGAGSFAEGGGKAIAGGFNIPGVTP